MITSTPRRDDSKIFKTLTLSPMSGDKGDWYLGLDVKDAARQENSVRLGLPLTGGELHTIRALSEVKRPLLYIQPQRLLYLTWNWKHLQP